MSSVLPPLEISQWGLEHGAETWKKIEDIIRAIPCETCREHGLDGISALRDLIKIMTGREPYDDRTFYWVAEKYQDALSMLKLREPSKFRTRCPCDAFSQVHLSSMR